MKITAFALVVLLAALAPLRAELVWEKTEIELHPGPNDATAVGNFKYENKGSAPVHIASVHTSCGCTTAALKKNDVAPGEKGEITATFNIGGRTGTQQKTITVTTDDPKQPTTVLTLRAVIAQAFELQPAFVFWQAGEAPKPKTISAKAAKEMPVQNIEVSSSSPDFITKVTSAGAGEFRIDVQPKDTSKPSATTLSVKTDTGKSYYATARVMPAASKQP